MALEVYANMEVEFTNLLWTPDREVDENLKRIADMHLVAVGVRGYARRLGGDATRDELADDKRRAKRIAHLMSNLYALWGGDAAWLARAASDIPPDVRAAAAIVEWEPWCNHWNNELVARLTRVATAALKLGYRKDGNKMCHRLNIEIVGVADAIREGR